MLRPISRFTLVMVAAGYSEADSSAAEPTTTDPSGLNCTALGMIGSSSGGVSTRGEVSEKFGSFGPGV